MLPAILLSSVTDVRMMCADSLDAQITVTKKSTKKHIVSTAGTWELPAETCWVFIIAEEVPHL